MEDLIKTAEEMGISLRQIAEGLWSVKTTWCNVIISENGNSPKWRVSRQCCKRWRTVYRGPSLRTALQKANEWL
jgi:hypothetical protein